MGRTPLSWAAEKGHAKVAKVLVDFKASVDAKDDEEGRTPLSRAAENGHTEVMKVLLDAKANVDMKDNVGRAPLNWATWRGHIEAIEVLLAAGADVDVMDNLVWMHQGWQRAEPRVSSARLVRDFGMLITRVTNRSIQPVQRVPDCQKHSSMPIITRDASNHNASNNT